MIRNHCLKHTVMYVFIRVRARVTLNPAHNGSDSDLELCFTLLLLFWCVSLYFYANQALPIASSNLKIFMAVQ